jgi:galactofuranosylgalactofuranosylrhamnosyl-N-acetylglucosaminyl-diphospho-decaprenol beta-1,5/1,6-galactofuranosyltransferase
MHRDVLNRLPELRELRKRFDDSRSQSDLDAFPSPRRRKPPRRGKEPTAPTGRLARGKTMVAGALRQVLPVRDMARHNPEANVPHVDLKWWLLSQFDSALVSSADGTEASWYKRDRDLFASLMKRSIALHARLTAEWPQLVEQYKTALPELASPESWHETFATSEQRS